MLVVDLSCITSGYFDGEELSMKTFLRFFGVFLLSVVTVGLIIPNKVDVRRSVEIDAPVQEVHRYINDLEQWSNWSPWLALDPSIKTTFGEIRKGIGASQSWRGTSGNGAMTITESSPANGINYKMSFEGDPTRYQAGLSYQQKGSKTIVTWYMTGAMEPIIIGNYFSLLMDSLIGDSFVMGLEQLKVLVEESR